MNRAAANAKGEWILPLADDDLLLPGCLETLLEHKDGRRHHLRAAAGDGKQGPLLVLPGSARYSVVRADPQKPVVRVGRLRRNSTVRGRPRHVDQSARGRREVRACERALLGLPAALGEQEFQQGGCVSITADKVSVVIPTRGNVDMTEILESLTGFGEVIVWVNGAHRIDIYEFGVLNRQIHDVADLGIYSRFAAIEHAKFDVIATLSDDVVVTHWNEILAAYKPGVVTISYPQDWTNDIPWICCGTVFDKGTEKRVFDLYQTMFEIDDDLMFYIADGVFAELCHPRNVLAYPYKEASGGPTTRGACRRNRAGMTTSAATSGCAATC